MKTKNSPTVSRGIEALKVDLRFVAGQAFVQADGRLTILIEPSRDDPNNHRITLVDGPVPSKALCNLSLWIQAVDDVRSVQAVQTDDRARCEVRGLAKGKRYQLLAEEVRTKAPPKDDSGIWVDLIGNYLSPDAGRSMDHIDALSPRLVRLREVPRYARADTEVLEVLSHSAVVDTTRARCFRALQRYNGRVARDELIPLAVEELRQHLETYRAHTFDPARGRAIGWLTKVIECRVADAAKFQRERLLDPVSIPSLQRVPLSRICHTLHADCNPEWQVEVAEQLEKVRGFLKTLPPDKHVQLARQVLDGEITREEAAQEAQVHPSTIGRWRDKLVKCIQRHLVGSQR
jgi:DNA-directed RNA polymerase specialized sigma24 family protein